VNDLLTRFWDEIVARPSGRMAVRFYLQPLMATIFAVRDGLRDAQNEKPAYLWAVLNDPAYRAEGLRHAWKSIGKVFVLAMILDTVYQVVVLRGFRPVQTISVAVALAIVPYVIFRGPVNRIARSLTRRRPPGSRRAA
jgi:hypothetical protein